VSPKDGSAIAMVFAEASGEDNVSFGPPQPVPTARRTGVAFLISYIDRVIARTESKSLFDFVANLDAK